MNGHTGLHLAVMCLELGRIRIPWDVRIWKGKGTASPMKLALRMLASLPTVLTERYHVVVLADSWFASKGFIEGIHERGFQAVLGVRPDRNTINKAPISRLKKPGKVQLAGPSIPVWIAWFYLTVKDKPDERRFVLSTLPMTSRKLVRLGRHRWRIEAFFKTIKHTFALSKSSQCTGLGCWGSCFCRSWRSCWRSRCARLPLRGR